MKSNIYDFNKVMNTEYKWCWFSMFVKGFSMNEVLLSTINDLSIGETIIHNMAGIELPVVKSATDRYCARLFLR